jgi:hypothetical protein
MSASCPLTPAIQPRLARGSTTRVPRLEVRSPKPRSAALQPVTNSNGRRQKPRYQATGRVTVTMLSCSGRTVPRSERRVSPKHFCLILINTPESTCHTKPLRLKYNSPYRQCTGAPPFPSTRALLRRCTVDTALICYRYRQSWPHYQWESHRDTNPDSSNLSLGFHDCRQHFGSSGYPMCSGLRKVFAYCETARRITFNQEVACWGS